MFAALAIGEGQSNCFSTLHIEHNLIKKVFMVFIYFLLHVITCCSQYELVGLRISTGEIQRIRWFFFPYSKIKLAFLVNIKLFHNSNISNPFLEKYILET